TGDRYSAMSHRPPSCQHHVERSRSNASATFQHRCSLAGAGPSRHWRFPCGTPIGQGKDAREPSTQHGPRDCPSAPGGRAHSGRVSALQPAWLGPPTSASWVGVPSCRGECLPGEAEMLGRALRTLFFGVVIGGVAVGACLAALVPGVVEIASAHHYTVHEFVRLRNLAQKSSVYWADGTPMGELGLQDRLDVKYSDLAGTAGSQRSINAVIAIV